MKLIHKQLNNFLSECCCVVPGESIHLSAFANAFRNQTGLCWLKQDIIDAIDQLIKSDDSWKGVIRAKDVHNYIILANFTIPKHKYIIHENELCRVKIRRKISEEDIPMKLIPYLDWIENWGNGRKDWHLPSPQSMAEILEALPRLLRIARASVQYYEARMREADHETCLAGWIAVTDAIKKVKQELTDAEE